MSMLRIPALHLPFVKNRPLSTSVSRSMILPSKTELYEQTDARWLFNETERELSVEKH